MPGEPVRLGVGTVEGFRPRGEPGTKVELASYDRSEWKSKDLEPVLCPTSER